MSKMLADPISKPPAKPEQHAKPPSRLPPRMSGPPVWRAATSVDPAPLAKRSMVT
jgi:hypothetical protein